MVASPITEQLSGKVEKVIFYNPQNGYTVLHLLEEKSHKKVVVVGHFAQSLFNEHLILQGQWQDHPRHGQQFVSKEATLVKSDPALAIQKLLIHQLDGIGPSYAKKLQQTFGEELLHILEHKPERLREIPGIGKERYKKIIASWQQHKASHDIMLFLISHQLGQALAARIYKKYGKDTIERVTSNPYRLINDIEGIGFQIADKIAAALEITKEAPARLAAGIIYILQQATKQGHCATLRNELLLQAESLLGVSSEKIAAVLATMVNEKKLYLDEIKAQDCLFLPDLWHQERSIAQKILTLLKEAPVNNDLLLNKLTTLLKEEAFALSSEQTLAIQQALQNKVFVLTGGPGVGKTTLVRLLAKVFIKNNLRVMLAAPTGRAAKRLSEVSKVNAKTIHRLLEYDPFTQRFAYDAYHPLPYDAIILDEVSMLDVPLCAAILQALSPTTRLILVGDVDQLASVGPGEVLRALIASHKVPSFFLTTIFRQQQQSQIIINAHRVNQGLLPEITTSNATDFYWVKSITPQEQQQKIIKMVAKRLPERFGFSPVDDVQVLTPMNEGMLGVNTLNVLLQQEINQPSSDKKQLHFRDYIFREGDKVIQIVNNYEKNIFNGDIGKIINVNLESRTLKVNFFSQTVDYGLKEMEQLRLAYAISIHKSQGSEYPAVVVVLSMLQKMMLKRNLLYTAISRGKSCVIIASCQHAVEAALNDNSVASRISKLEEWLQHDKF